MLGSAATDLAWLATGRLDAVIMHSNNTWDVAAGIALARAAGATITTQDGRPYGVVSPNLVAATPRTHSSLVEALSRVPLIDVTTAATTLNDHALKALASGY